MPDYRFKLLGTGGPVSSEKLLGHPGRNNVHNPIEQSLIDEFIHRPIPDTIGMERNHYIVLFRKTFNNMPAAGFGLGDVVLMELLSETELLPALARGVDDVVVAFEERHRAIAARLAERLRRADRRVDLVLGTPRLKRVLADADRSGAARLWLLGPDEVTRGVATVRDLASGEQREEKLDG